MRIPIRRSIFHIISTKLYILNGSFDDIKIKLQTHLQQTNYTRNLIEKIRCNNCYTIYPEEAFCDEKFCEVFDNETKISYYTDRDHLSEDGWNREIPLFRLFF